MKQLRNHYSPRNHLLLADQCRQVTKGLGFLPCSGLLAALQEAAGEGGCPLHRPVLSACSLAGLLHVGGLLGTNISFFEKPELFCVASSDCYMVPQAQNRMLACPSGRSGSNSDFWEMFLSVTLRALFVFLSGYFSEKELSAISSVVLLCTYIASTGFCFL